jgi:hypothetical protein
MPIPEKREKSMHVFKINTHADESSACVLEISTRALEKFRRYLKYPHVCLRHPHVCIFTIYAYSLCKEITLLFSSANRKNDDLRSLHAFRYPGNEVISQRAPCKLSRLSSAG